MTKMITLKFEESFLEEVDKRAREHHFTSRAEYIRQVLREDFARRKVAEKAHPPRKEAESIKERLPEKEPVAVEEDEEESETAPVTADETEDKEGAQTYEDFARNIGWGP